MDVDLTKKPEDVDEEAQEEVKHVVVVSSKKKKTTGQNRLRRRHVNSCLTTCTFEVPDGGWGWGVLAGALAISIIAPPVIGSFGILLYDIRQQMGVSVANTAWISSLAQCMSFIATPLVVILSSWISFRKVAFFGGISISFGMFLTYFARRLVVVYVTIGLLGGLGMGLSTKASMFMVNLYFNKRRGFATGCYYTGAAISRLIFPMTIQLLLLEYGYRGTILFWSGIMANICAAAALFQPVKRHLVHVPGPKCRAVLKPYIDVGNGLPPGDDDNDKVEAEMEPMMKRSSCQLNCTAEDTVPQKDSAISPVFQDDSMYKQQQHEEVEDNVTQGHSGRSSNKAKLDFSLFREPRFYVVCCTGICSAVANGNMYVFIPSMGRSKGLTAVNAAWLLSSVGVGEVIGRLVVPWIQDARLVHPKYFFMVGAVVSSFVTAVLTTPESFSTMVSLCIVLGVSAGSLTGLGSILNVEAIGLEKLQSSLSFTQFLQGVFALPAGPILGAIRDATGDYVRCFYVLSAIYMCAFFVWLLETVLTRRHCGGNDEKKISKEEC